MINSEVMRTKIIEIVKVQFRLWYNTNGIYNIIMPQTHFGRKKYMNQVQKCKEIAYRTLRITFAIMQIIQMFTNTQKLSIYLVYC